MNPVVPYLCINSTMKFNTSDFSTIILAFDINIVDVIMFYNAERSAHTSANASLLTIINRIITYQMRADILLFHPHRTALNVTSI